MLVSVSASEEPWACCNGRTISRMLPVHQCPFFAVLRVVVQIPVSGVVSLLLLLSLCPPTPFGKGCSTITNLYVAVTTGHVVKVRKEESVAPIVLLTPQL